MTGTEILRRAAAEMRDAPTFSAQDGAVMAAVADWLEEVAAWQDEGLGAPVATNLRDAWEGMERCALDTARAYFGVGAREQHG
jgi:hypothetical protein